jgi:alpha-tubulin suppressor-like RCC1 family protein
MGGLETFTTVAAWGDNFFGQLGNGVPLPYPDDSRSTMPLEVSNLDGAELKAIAGGANHSLALKNDGTVLAWGLNQDGELGDGTNTDSSTPVEVKDPNDPSGYLSGVKALTAGSSHSLALKDDGTVWAWGDNRASQGTRIGGQLGDDEITSSNTPLQVSDLPGGIEAIATGAEHGLALKDDGTVWAWGYNFFGQLGNGTTTDSSSKPVQVSELDGIEVIAAGGSFSLALKDDGTVWAWGNNWFGQLGDGTSTDDTLTTCEVTMIGGRTSSSCPDSNTPV